MSALKPKCGMSGGHPLRTRSPEFTGVISSEAASWCVGKDRKEVAPEKSWRNQVIRVTILCGE